MTSQKDQIQALIVEIDGVLQRANPRLPWVMSGEAAQQRQVLERVRNYLVSLQQQPSFPSGSGIAPGTDILAQDLYYQPSQDPTRSPAFENTTAADATTQQLLERVLQEVSQLRVSLAPANQHPTHAELLQVLMNRLQEHLTQQIAQALNPAGGQGLPPRSDYMLAAGMPPSALSTAQYEQLQALRRRSDQMLVNLDATLNIVFESLQRNIQTYQDSLSQGLERMYSLGQQSEITFKALVEMLAQQLQQEASTYLPPATEAPRSHPVPSIPATEPVTQPAEPSIAPATEPAIAAEPPSTKAVRPFTSRVSSASVVPSFPYAGTEILATDFSQADLAAPFNPPTEPSPLQADAETNAAIAAWLNFARAQDQQPPASLVEQEPPLPALDLSDLELPAVASPHSVPPTSQQAANHPPDAAREEEDSTEIDAALKLLENLSAELQTASPAISLEEAEVQLNEMLGGMAATGEGSSLLPDISNDAQDELDEFYQSLFGGFEAETASDPASKAGSEIEVDSVVEFFSATATEELSLENLFEPAAPTLPPIQPSASLFDDFTDLEEVPSQPAPVIPPPPAIDFDDTTLSSLEQIGSLTDLFSLLQREQEHSTPIDFPIAPASTPPIAEGSRIEVSFEQTSSELISNEMLRPVQPTPEKQEVEFTVDPLEDQYTRAAFDENLLPDAPVDTIDLNLELDEMTLSSLDEDLANLESFGYEFGSGVNREPAIAQPNDLPQSSSAAFTLDEFTSDLSPTRPPLTSLPEDLPQSSSAAFTLDEFATHLSPSAPPGVEAQAEDNASPFTLEGMDDLFGDAPSLDSSTAKHGQTEPQDGMTGRNPPISEIPPFKPSSFNRKPEAEDLPPFKLERLDSLFIEVESLFIEESTLPEPASSSPPELELDEAFESLLGPIASPIATDATQPAAPPDSEKKKS